jgi:hypothetical protein
MPKRRFPEGPNLRRGRPTRAPKLRVHIYAEGKNTEPDYFRRFAAEHGNSLVQVYCEGGAGVPATLVETARVKLRSIKRSSDSFERNDQVWIIFDEDEHPKVQQSINEAKAVGIAVGYSNPCFEVWLLIHHTNHDAPDGRHKVQKKLGEHDRSYEAKGSKTPNYDLLSPNYAVAKGRAVAMRVKRDGEGTPRGCPYTDIDELTEIIVANGRAKT